MMVQVTKTHIILCLMVFHSIKMKNDLIFGFSTWKQLENTLFSNSYAHTHKELISNQLYSSDKKMVQLTKTHILFYVLWSFTQPKAKMIWYLDSANENSWKTLSFSNSYAHTDQKQNSNQLLQEWHNDGSSNRNTYYYMFDNLPPN